MTPPAGSFWKTVGAFVVIGPYVGGLIAGSQMIASGFGGFAETGLQGWFSLPLVALLGYPFGALPAAITGAVSAFLSGHIGSRLVWVLLSTVTGFVAASLASSGAPGHWAFYGTMGAAGGLASSLVGLQLRPRWTA